MNEIEAAEYDMLFVAHCPHDTGQIHSLAVGIGRGGEYDGALTLLIQPVGSEILDAVEMDERMCLQLIGSLSAGLRESFRLPLLLLATEALDMMDDEA